MFVVCFQGEVAAYLSRVSLPNRTGDLDDSGT